MVRPLPLQAKPASPTHWRVFARLSEEQATLVASRFNTYREVDWDRLVADRIQAYEAEQEREFAKQVALDRIRGGLDKWPR